MSLVKNENITITGRSVIDGAEVCGFQATLSTTDPKNITFSSWQIDKEKYKANRSLCRADEAEFEDYAFARQDEIIAEMTMTEGE